VVQLCAIVCGLILREKLRPCSKNVLARHLVTTLIGIALGHFCYGNQMWHIYFHTAITYTATRYLPRDHIHIILFVFSMTYLSIMHIYRQIYDYGNYVLDITGPIMIITQKVTLLGFAYYDGIRPIGLLTADQKSQMIKKEPKLIELVSYIFNFQGIIVGPLCTYSDYMDWITGENITKYENDINNPDRSKPQQPGEPVRQPKVIHVVLKKLFVVICLGVFFQRYSQNYTVRSNISPEILAKPLWYRFVYIYFTSFGQRVKYYIAWVLADVVNNSAGLGFSGYNQDGSAKWDLVTNVKIQDLERSTSVKVAFDRWNVSTVTWLRRIAYDRMPTGKTFWVFLLSAFWHGFYPGYYLTFVLSAFLVYAGRGVSH
jgi:lysophospholipid acyltransferase 1/2